MRKFAFRLQRVLDYRELQEGWAQDAFLEAKASRISAEAELADIEDRRERAHRSHSPSVEHMRNLELFLAKLTDDIEAQESVISILKGEEEKAHQEWLEARKNRKALDKLKEQAEDEWRKGIEKEETKLLDDWTSARRPA